MPRKIDTDVVKRALELNSQGKKQREIAEQLHIGERTVQNYVNPRWLERNSLSYLIDDQAATTSKPDLSISPYSLNGALASWQRWRTLLVAGGTAALLIIATAVVGFQLSRSGTNSPPVEAEEGTGGAHSSPHSPSPSEIYLAIGDRVAVTGAIEGVGVFSSPPDAGSTSEAIKVIPAGYEGQIIGGPRESGGVEWWEVQWVTNVTGWAQAASSDGEDWIRPLPGQGIFPQVSDLGLSFRVQVYEDAGQNGLAVRSAPGVDQPILVRKPVGAQGWTSGSPKRDGDLIWWKTKWGDGTEGWSEDSGVATGVYLEKLEAVGQQKAKLTLYVHRLGKDDLVVAGARVEVHDAAGEVFDRTTNDDGFVEVFGVPGTWNFTISAPGFKDNAWEQEITASTTKHSFFVEQNEN